MSNKQPATNLQQLLAQQAPRRRGLIITVIALVIIGLIAVFFFKGNTKAPQQFITAEVQRGDLTVTVTATGTLAPLNQVDVGSEISGTIESIAVDFNDRVKRGQVLARINTDEQQARVTQVRAALDVAEARVLQANATVQETELKLKRCETLAQQGLCPSQDMEATRAARDRAVADQSSAKAQVSQAKATLDAEQTRLTKAAIRSPIDGIVLKRNIEPGQTVAASLQAPVLFTLAESLSQMELHVSVDEADIGQIHVGQIATFTVDAYGDRSFPAKIIQVRLAPQTTGGVVSYETVLALDNKDLALRPGMTATAQVMVEQIHDALLVPNAALRFTPPVTQAKEQRSLLDQLFPRWGRRDRNEQAQGKNKQKQVWLLQNNVPTPVDVKTGASDGRMTQVTTGELQPGTALLVDVATGPAR
ncbi:MAG: efflux RND transporter periplasmic adaptor subunit [Gammaproteobacteria bacterium]|nr:efflux RND transporter periplasmic adaptor subunit [Gammaproteobacteria bacterium]